MFRQAGIKDEVLACSLSSFAQMYYTIGYPKKALPMVHEAKDIFARKFGNDDPSVGAGWLDIQYECDSFNFLQY